MFAPASPSIATPDSGAGVHGCDGLEAVGASVDRSDSGNEYAWLVLVTGRSEDDGTPVGAMSSRVGMGEDDDGTPEGVRWSVRY